MILNHILHGFILASRSRKTTELVWVELARNRLHGIVVAIDGMLTVTLTRVLPRVLPARC